jgi:pimeloyl-ACP methyl ester carboxylesterase
MDDHLQQTSWFDELWPRLVVASGVGYVAATYGISRWLTRRSPAKIDAPFLPNCTMEALTCRTSDGILLKGWCVEPVRPRATIALFHGMRLNRLHTLDRIAFLTAAGYRCIAFDHRAHGESEGRWCSFGFQERHDVAAVFDLVRSRWPDEPRGALGVSMGAAAICFAAKIARGFDAVVIESVYAKLANAFDQRIGCGYPSWFRHFRDGVVWLTERRLGASIAEVAPLAHVAHLSPRPVLVITGSDDPHAPPREVQMLAEQIPADSRFHVVPGAGHGDVCTQGGVAYQDLLLTFFDQHLLASRISSSERPPLAA